MSEIIVINQPADSLCMQRMDANIVGAYDN